MNNFMEIKKAVVEGDRKGTVKFVQDALDNGVDVMEIINNGLIPGIKEVGELYETGERFVPDMILSASCVKEGLKVTESKLSKENRDKKATLVIGTVHGDLHDIGKNLVVMVLESGGYNVVDLGVDVKPEEFVKAVQEYKPEFLGMSALLTTTMRVMNDVIDALKEAELRDEVKVAIGGAVTSEGFAKSIGADGYGRNVSDALKMFDSWL
jgi:5-methyltetrahydrofolate--homocysteine methyltransferase